MRLTQGSPVPSLKLPDLDGMPFDLATLKGTPFMVAFYRFASCTFCNLRVRELVTRYGELGDGCTVVVVFDAAPEHLRLHAEHHHAPFPLLADSGRTHYDAFGVEYSWPRVSWGLIKRLPTLLKGFAAGYLPLDARGRLDTLPAEFLVDAGGIITHAHYARDEGDHLSFEQLKEFATGVKA